MSTTTTVITTTKHPTTPSTSLTILQATSSCEDGGAEYASKRARSRMGCFTCRKRKKRCDEVRPLCGACARLKLDCQYPTPGTERKNKKRRKSDAAEDEQEDLVSAEKSNTLSSEIATIAEEAEPELTLDVVPFEDVIPFDSIDLDIFLNDRDLNGDNSTKQPDFMLNIPRQLQQAWSGDASLDITGTQLFDYFKSRLARIICVSSDDSNSFLKIFVPMATQDNAVLYSLVAWAGFHMGKGQLQDYALEYLDKAIQNVRHDGSITSLASMLLICAAEICSGDVMHWDKHLTSAADMIKKAGGLASFAEDNTLRWLASNFAYHDILASSTCSRRTHFGSDEYDQIMRHGFGLDSLIGCCQPLFKILSEISELAVDAQKALEVEQLRSIKARAKELEEKISVCHPDPMDMICLDRQELEQQLTLFEIFQLTAHLHLRQAVLRTNSASIEMQCIWHDLLASIDVVMGTRVEGGLVFPLFIAGINCTRQDMRQLMCIRIERYYERNLARNIKRARHLMEEVWSRDDYGTKHVDWYKIIQNRGWDICFA